MEQAQAAEQIFGDRKTVELLGLLERGSTIVWIQPVCLTVLYFALNHTWLEQSMLHCLAAMTVFSALMRGLLVWRLKGWEYRPQNSLSPSILGSASFPPKGRLTHSE